jgi:hypothetical protein
VKKNEIQIVKTGGVNKDKEIIIPYDTDLTDYNKTTFRKSIIDHTIMINPYLNLQNKIIGNQTYPTTLKTIVDNTTFPRTTNTLLTAYYSSYIDTVYPQNSSYNLNQLVRYFVNYNEIMTAIVFSIINSTVVTPRLEIAILNPGGSPYKNYIITQSTPKVVIYLTADLAVARPGLKNVSAEFLLSKNLTRCVDDFYQDFALTS